MSAAIIGGLAALLPGVVGAVQAFDELSSLGWLDWLPEGDLRKTIVVAFGAASACVLGGLLAMGTVGCFERD